MRLGAALPRLDTGSQCLWVARFLELMHELCSLSLTARHDTASCGTTHSESILKSSRPKRAHGACHPRRGLTAGLGPKAVHPTDGARVPAHAFFPGSLQAVRCKVR